MQTDFPYLKIMKHDRAILGKKDPTTRIYRFSGGDTRRDAGDWYDRLCARFPSEGFVSPGGVSMYVPVSRAAVYQRINAGKLTAFCYHPTEWSRTLFGGLRKTRKSPYMYIPVSECKAWAAELERRVEGFKDPEWLPDRQFAAEVDKLEKWPKHKGKTSVPKWKRKLRAANKPSIKRILGLVGLLLPSLGGM